MGHNRLHFPQPNQGRRSGLGSRVLGLAFAVAVALPAGAATLEEVVVTAQKRTESLQDVSLSVNVVSGEAIADLGLANFDALEVPGVHIAQGGMNENVYIRGVGSTGNNFGFEQSVPFFIDGVYLGRARAQRLGFLDVERVEILKGPQPIYLGKNAIGGAVSITSKRPGDEPEFSIDLYNEFEHDETSVTAVASGPVSDSLKARGVVRYRELTDGWVENRSTSQMSPEQEDTLGRFSFIWDASENIEVFGKLEYVDTLWDGRNAEVFDCDPGSVVPSLGDADCKLDGVSYIDFDPANYPADPDTGDTPLVNTRPTRGQTFINSFEMTSGLVSVNWALGNINLVSNTAYLEFDNRQYNKADFVPTDRGVAEFREDFSQFSQELRLESMGDGALSWIAGAYYDTNDNFTDSPNNVPALAPMNMSFQQARVADETADSWAVFGEVSYDFTDAFRVKAGARYTEVEKDIDFFWDRWDGVNSVLTAYQSATFADSRSDDSLQPALTLEWRPLDEILLYGSWKEGFKAGGFDHSATNDFTNFQFDQEEVTAYEAGAKWRDSSGRATVNVALFRNEFTDLQVTTRDPENFTFVTQNAAEATTQGVELEFAWAATESLTLSGGVVYLDTQYDDFGATQCYPGQTVEQGCVGGSQSLTGAPLQFAPEFSGSLVAQWERPVTDALEMRVRLSMFFTDDYASDTKQDPSTIIPGYEKYDARVAFGPFDRKWEVAFIGRNLTDELVSSWRGDVPGAGSNAHFALMDRTRQLALQARYRF
jgi:outer membrane receptor protein involved in Fe transport